MFACANRANVCDATCPDCPKRKKKRDQDDRAVRQPELLTVVPRSDER